MSATGAGVGRSRARARSRARSRADWVGPLCHELGNLLAGIRLTTHFLGGRVSEGERRKLARETELLTAQAGAWVALIRPLRAQRPTQSRLAPAELLGALERSVTELLESPDQLRIPKGRGLPDVRIDSDAVHHLLVLLVAGAISESDGRRVRIMLREESRHVVMTVADATRRIPVGPDGPSPRGRELARLVGDELLRIAGGRLVVAATSRGNRLELWLPRAPRAPARRKVPTRARRRR